MRATPRLRVRGAGPVWAESGVPAPSVAVATAWLPPTHPGRATARRRPEERPPPLTEGTPSPAGQPDLAKFNKMSSFCSLSPKLC